MNLKIFVLAGVSAALTASAAFAAPPTTHPGNGAKPSTTGAGCKPQITVVLHGTVATAPGATPALPFGLMVNVTSANSHHGKAFVKPNEPVTVIVGHQGLPARRELGCLPARGGQGDDPGPYLQGRPCKRRYAESHGTDGERSPRQRLSVKGTTRGGAAFSAACPPVRMCPASASDEGRWVGLPRESSMRAAISRPHPVRAQHAHPSPSPC